MHATNSGGAKACSYATQQDLSVMCSATTFKVRAGRHSNPGSLANFAAIRCASSRVSRLVAEGHRPR
jgi:hypothetical protein